MRYSPAVRVKPTQFALITLCLTMLYTLTTPAFAIDKSKYITIDEITTDMDAYCLTVLSGVKIEKFPIKILSVVRGTQPGLDRILVVGTGPEFEHIGPVQGCSGSPVYINGRMAGALSAGWASTKDPLYLVTPIADMLDVGKFKPSPNDQFPDASWTSNIDFSKPIDLTEIAKNISQKQLPNSGQFSNSLFPLMTSFPDSVCQQIAPQLRSVGFTPYSNLAAAAAPMPQIPSDFKYEPGSVLAIPFVSGDITMAGTGTVTEVVGNKVYAFGHHMDGTGPTNLPMSNGYIHTVIAASSGMSRKYSTPGTIKGALRSDESNAVYGEIDKTAPLIPMKITVDRFNDTQIRTYNCNVAVSRSLTAQVVMSSIVGAASMKGAIPPEHFVTYSANIEVDGFEPITFKNVSSGRTVFDMLSETSSAISLLLTNPYEKADIKSMEFDVKIEPRNIRSAIDSIQISNSTVKPGDTLDIYATLKPYMAPKKLQKLSITIPADTPPGQYEIMVAGASEYLKLNRKLAPHKFTASDLPGLVDSLRNIVAVDRGKMYVVMPLKPEGIVINEKPLPYLPSTKALLLTDTKRSVKLLPNNNWIENSIPVDTIVVNSSKIKITVEK
ncbi:MAG: hypothetical protein KAS23_04635 [Anaerohalosphaera sp.]|nr:hypothetical protein [Anaerohalosphaera sp.]